MIDDRNFGFCPRCGALMQNGTCQSCGYGRGLGQQEGQEPAQMPVSPYVQTTGKSQTPPKSKKLVVALCIGGGVLLLLGLIAAVVFCISMALTNVSTDRNHQMDDGYYSDDYYEPYKPSEDDPYYKEISDATRTDLSYKICWASDSLNPDDPEEEWSYYATYPVLEAAGGNGAAINSINEIIGESALRYKTGFREYAGGVNTYGYVTYMDEEKISVVFQHSLYEKDGIIPLLDALTFELKTGSLIKPEAMIEPDDTLAMHFRAQDKTQNGGVTFVQNLSDEELISYLQDPEKAVAFYTPVGLEIGFNFENGWVTVTLKEKAL